MHAHALEPGRSSEDGMTVGGGNELPIYPRPVLGFKGLCFINCKASPHLTVHDS